MNAKDILENIASQFQEILGLDDAAFVHEVSPNLFLEGSAKGKYAGLTDRRGNYLYARWFGTMRYAESARVGACKVGATLLKVSGDARLVLMVKDGDPYDMERRLRSSFALLKAIDGVDGLRVEPQTANLKTYAVVQQELGATDLSEVKLPTAQKVVSMDMMLTYTVNSEACEKDLKLCT